tara:strand:+ start:2075 stop:2662 length:588 start_codon:yes stop_codon:yes gene_type:complete
MQNTIFLKARYLNAQLRDCEDAFLKYYKEFFKEVALIVGTDDERENKTFEEGLSKLVDTHKKPCSQDAIETESLSNNFLNKKFKRLYKKIVQICHPDKHPNHLSEDDKDNLVKIYNDCTSAVKNKDLYFFLECASKLYINIPKLTEKEEEVLRKNCLKIEEEIKNIKNTYPWIWGKESSEEQRRMILSSFIQKSF